jgi:hypothetical protein
MVMTMLAGCVTMLKMAMVVNAVSTSSLWPRWALRRVNRTRVMAGENIPSAFAKVDQSD